MVGKACLTRSVYNTADNLSRYLAQQKGGSGLSGTISIHKPPITFGIARFGG